MAVLAFRRSAQRRKAIRPTVGARAILLMLGCRRGGPDMKAYLHMYHAHRHAAMSTSRARLTSASKKHADADNRDFNPCQTTNNLIEVGGGFR